MPVVTRRMTLRSLPAVGVVAALSGCDLSPSESSPITPTADPPRSLAPVDPDTALVTGLARQVEGVASLIRNTRRTYPALRPRLGPAQRIHRAHLRRLAEIVGALDPEAATTDSEATPEPNEVPATPVAALRAVRRAENTLTRAATKAALEVGRTDLASVLATLAGSSAQLSTALSEPAPEGQ